MGYPRSVLEKWIGETTNKLGQPLTMEQQKVLSSLPYKDLVQVLNRLTAKVII